MQIGIDTLKLEDCKPSGIGVYLYNLLSELKKIPGNDIIKEYSGPKVINESFTRHFVLPGRMNADQLDVAHFPDHILPLLPIRAKKIITVHDLAFYRYPQYFSLATRIYKNILAKSSVRQADKIIAVSRSTKNDLVKIFGVPEEKIEIIYNGVSPRFKPRSLDQQVRQKLFAEYGFKFKKYILFVGTIEPRKNLGLVIRAFPSIAATYPDLGLVICGKRGWLSNDIMREIEKTSNDEKIKYLEYVPEDKLIEIYGLAEVFVYPSYYEGFGLPPLEAMACGTPVISSNVSSLPEVIDGAGELIDPNKVDDLIAALRRILERPDHKAELAARGLKKAREFSWPITAQKTMELYRSLSVK